MSKEENFFEVGISRHAPKVEKPGQVFDVTTQNIDIAEAETELEDRVKSLLENLEQAPQGTIMALESSNIGRASQTVDLFIKKFKEMLTNREDIEMVELASNEEESESILEKIRENPNKKFIITNLRPTWLLGFKENDKNVPTINKWKNKLRGNEDFLGKVWSVQSNEISLLHNELINAGFDIEEEEIKPSEFSATPEEQALRQIRFMQGMKSVGEKHFPGRPLILEGVSHNMRSDFTSLALLGEDISVETINRVLGGKFRLPFERSSVTFSADNNVKVSYRGFEKEYSDLDFKKIIEGLREKAKSRKEEWRIE